jgi:hypothetical protein
MKNVQKNELHDKEDEEIELFSLKADDKQDTLEETALQTAYIIPNEIRIDVNYISREIGISEGDYRLFINEYIYTALESKKELQSNDSHKTVHAISTLSHLAEVLHLPTLGEILSKINNTSQEIKSEMINSFYTSLSKITLYKTNNKDSNNTENYLEKLSADIVYTKLNNLPLNLDDVTPIHFDFILEEAANDISLPVSLIEEFVLDFIRQAREETPKLISSYHKGDIQSVQQIGHLLQGASANLRIVPIADTLYEIEFCEDPSKLVDLIKDYWGHFLSFEKQINMANK